MLRQWVFMDEWARVCWEGAWDVPPANVQERPGACCAWGPVWLCVEPGVQSRWGCRGRCPLVMWKWSWRTGLLRREAHGSQRSLDFRTSRCHKGRGEWPWWRVFPAVQSVAASQGRGLKFKAPALLPTILILQVWGGAQHLCLKKLSRWSDAGDHWPTLWVNAELSLKSFVNPKNYQICTLSICPGRQVMDSSVRSLKRIHKFYKA